MFKLLLFFLAISAWEPVLHEGRYQPYGTLPPQEQEHAHVLDNFDAVEGQPYLTAHGKALCYPTKGQLKAELFLHTFPTKWVLIALYLLAIFWRPLAPLPFALHTLFLALTCYILARPPVSNMAETIAYVPWIAMLSSFFFKKPRAGAAVAAVLLFFLPAHPHFQTVQAVLDSQYWLIIHVLMVVGSYGLFFFAGILGHLYLIKESVALEKTLLRALYIGTALLIGGTILGGVWAAQSWGRFWDWDPKEAWAFISSALYLIWIHAYKFKKIGGKGLATGSIIGLMAITFTWYGVNYLLAAGMHSYGFGSGGTSFYLLYLGGEVIFLLSRKLFTKIG